MRNLLLTAAIASIGLAAGPVRAADKYFAYGPGTDTWDTVSSFWSAMPGGPYTGSWSASDNATFEGTAGAVSIVDTQLANRVTFSTDGYSLTNGALVLTGEATIANAVNAAVSSALIGTSDIAKTGAGTLTLSGTNTYTGATIIYNGTLTIGGSGQLGNGTYASAITINPGNTLQYASSATQLFSNGITGSGTLQADGTGMLTLYASGGDKDYQASLTGTGPVSMQGAGNWAGLHGDMTAYSGTMTVTGTAHLSNSGGNTGSALARFSVGSGATWLTSNEAGTKTVHLGELSGSGNLYGSGFMAGRNGTKTLSIGALGTSATYAGTIADNYLGGGSVVALTKTGGGTLTLSGPNTYSGATTINGGTLELAGNNGWNVRGGTYTVNKNGNLKVTSNAGLYNVGPNTIVNVNGGGALVWNALGGDVNSPYLNAISLDSANGAAATVSSTSSSGPRFGYVNHGVITSTGLVPNTWTAGLIVANGSGRTLTIQTAQDLTISGVIQDLSGYAGTPITKSGAGTLILTAANTYSGATTIGSGVLRIGVGGSISNSAAVVLGTNAVFDVSATGFTVGSGKTLQGSGSVTGDTAAAAGAMIVAGPPGGAGTLTFNGNLALDAGETTYFDLAGTTNAAGANDLVLVNGDLSPSNATIAVNLLAPPANGAYELFGYTGAKTSSFNTTLSGLPVPTRRTFALDESSTPHQVTLVVGGSPADLAWRSSSNPLWDAGASPGWLNTGTGSNEVFQAFDNVAFDDTPGVVTAVELSGVLRPASIAIDASSHSFSFTGSGRLAGSTGLAKTGTNSLTLATSGTNDFTGPVVIGAGTLIVAGTSPRPLGTGTITNDGTLAINRADNLTMDNPITGGGPLLVSGGGNLTLGASNSYTGGTTIGAGAVVMGSDTALGSGAVSLNGGGLARDHAGSTVANNIEIGAAGGSIAGRTSLIDDYVNFTGILSGGGALSARGLVSLENPANTYTGALTVLTGYSHLRLAASEVLGDTASVTLSGTGSFLRLDSGVTETVNGFSGAAGSVVFGVGQGATATLRVGANNASSSYAGSINDVDNVLALVKLGTGTLTLSGANAYTGNTIVSGGTLDFIFNPGLAIFSSANISNAAQVRIYGGNNAYNRVVGSLSGAGDFFIDGPGGGSLYENRVVLQGSSSSNSGTVHVINSGKLWFDRGGNPIGTSALVDVGALGQFYLYQGNVYTIGGLAGSGKVLGGDANSSTLALGNASATFSGAIQNGIGGNVLSLVKAGAGTQTLSGTNTYSGTTTITGGVLLVNGSNSGSGSVAVAADGVLGGSGRVAGPVTVNAGGRLAPGPAGPGTLTLDGGLALEDGAVMDFELGAASDLVLIRGAFTGAGTGGVTITISNRDGFSRPSYTLLEWSGATPAGVELDDFTVNPQIPIAYSGELAIEGIALVWRVGFIPGSVLTVR